MPTDPSEARPDRRSPGDDDGAALRAVLDDHAAAAYGALTAMRVRLSVASEVDPADREHAALLVARLDAALAELARTLHAGDRTSRPGPDETADPSC